MWQKGIYAGCWEVVKERKTSASFVITVIFLLIMQVIVGTHKALYYPIVVKADYSTFPSSQSAHHCIISLHLSRY
ncbi:hypothetical protein C2D56_02500 [Escherichia coli]|nr:hypothetical protein [Escherichia coli]EFO3774369.1 hypothetical protein [Escherichia coli]KAB3454424.1 hypothetical protein F9Z79_01170 [Escherichia coli]PBS05554.1 hypothetical protein COD33_01955 [Escherichia coli]TXW94718.1 hypothetical protein D4M50_17620 [Escherichia coli]